jgi:hypothetical protein
MFPGLDRLLVPLARLILARGGTYGLVEDHVKAAFLTAARQSAGPGVTDSRLSVMTGLQRRDIARLAALPLAPDAAPPTHLARLVMLWADDPAYRGADLPRHGPAPSFDALARQVRRDVHPRTLADQLVAAGTVADEGDHLRLIRTSHQPEVGSPDQLAYLAANLGDHLATAVANVLDDPRRLDRAAHANRLSPGAVAELSALWQDLAMAALHRIAARAEELQQDSPGTARFRAGAYVHDAEEAP